MQTIQMNAPIKIMIDLKYLGNSFGDARRQLKMPRKQMAKLLGITNTELSKIETGRLVVHRHLMTKLIYDAINTQI